MSVHVTSACWRESASEGAARLVLLSLADQANDDGWCWPSVESVAERCRVSARSAQRHIATLVELGEVERVDRPGRSTMYRVLLGWPGCEARRSTPDNLSPLSDCRGDTPVGGGVTPVSGGGDTAVTQKRKEPSGNRHKARTRATQRPKGWKPNDDHRALAASLGVNLEREVQQFADHHDAKGSTFKDWDAALRTWLRNAGEWSPAKGQQPRRRIPTFTAPEPPDDVANDPAAYRRWLAEAKAEHERKHSGE